LISWCHQLLQGDYSKVGKTDLEQLQLQVLRVLSVLSFDKRNCEQIRNMNGVEIILRVLQNCRNCHICKAGFWVLLNLTCVSNPCIKQFLDGDGLQVAVDTLQHFKKWNANSEGLIADILGTLLNVCMSPEVARKISQHVNTICSSMSLQALKGCELLQQRGCALLCKFTTVDDEMKLLVHKARGTHVALEALKHNRTVPKVLDAAFTLISNVSINTEVTTVVIKSQGLDWILKALTSHEENEIVQIAAISALRSLTGTADYSYKEMFDDWILDSTLRALAEFPTNSELCEYALGCLSNISFFKSWSDKVVEMQGIEAILDCIRTHSTSASVQREACFALWQITHSSENALAKVAEGDGSKLVLDSMRRHRKDAEVQAGGLGLLWNLIQSEDNTRQIEREQGIDVVIAAMHNFETLDVQKGGCAAIWALAELRGNYREGIARAGGVPAVVKAMRIFAEDNELQDWASNALYHLSENDSCRKRIVESDCILVVLQQILGKKERMACTMEAACGFLARVFAHEGRKPFEEHLGNHMPDGSLFDILRGIVKQLNLQVGDDHARAFRAYIQKESPQEQAGSPDEEEEIQVVKSELLCLKDPFTQSDLAHEEGGWPVRLPCGHVYNRSTMTAKKRMGTRSFTNAIVRCVVFGCRQILPRDRANLPEDEAVQKALKEKMSSVDNSSVLNAAGEFVCIDD